MGSDIQPLIKELLLSMHSTTAVVFPKGK